MLITFLKHITKKHRQHFELKDLLKSSWPCKAYSTSVWIRLAVV